MTSMRKLVEDLIRDYDPNAKWDDHDEFYDKWAAIFEENEQ